MSLLRRWFLKHVCASIICYCCPAVVGRSRNLGTRGGLPRQVLEPLARTSSTARWAERAGCVVVRGVLASCCESGMSEGGWDTASRCHGSGEPVQSKTVAVAHYSGAARPHRGRLSPVLESVTPGGSRLQSRSQSLAPDFADAPSLYSPFALKSPRARATSEASRPQSGADAGCHKFWEAGGRSATARRATGSNTPHTAPLRPPRASAQVLRRQRPRAPPWPPPERRRRRRPWSRRRRRSPRRRRGRRRRSRRSPGPRCRCRLPRRPPRHAAVRAGGGAA